MNMACLFMMYPCKQITFCGFRRSLFFGPIHCCHFRSLCLECREVMKSPVRLCHTRMCQTPSIASFCWVRSSSGRLNMSPSYSWSVVSCSRTWCSLRCRCQEDMIAVISVVTFRHELIRRQT